jgi:hypothetical protein
MNKIIIGVVLLFFTISPTLVSAWTVDCAGYDSDTSEYVYGECSNGDFSGYDSDTGEYVYGDCERGGNLEAYNSDTGEFVFGTCEA